MTNSIEDLVETLVQDGKVTKDPMQQLSHLRKLLSVDKQSDVDDLEDPFLTDGSFSESLDESKDDGDVHRSPFPDFTLDNIITNQDILNQFVCFVVMQRFGWKEKNGKTKKRPVLSKLSTNEKPQLANTLDEFIKWFQCQPVHAEILQAYLYSVDKAVQIPLVRKHTFNLATEWLRNELNTVIHAEEFVILKDFLLLGLCDVWSAVRSSVVARLSVILEVFSLGQISDFFDDLVKICQSPESTWQAKEGAIMAVNAVIRRFQWVGVEACDAEVIKEDVVTDSPQTQYFLKFGREELGGLPEFIASQVKSTVFPLLAHPQLTVRENATKAFSSYLSRCEFKEALSAFKDIIQQLCRDIPYDVSEKPPHLAVMDRKFTFMDAYEAEGLLGVCVCLVKHISPGFLLPNWPLYFSTFCLYLCHPASTVRQTASNVFKFLVAKDSHNPMILKLVLQGLLADWDVNQEELTRPCNLSVNPDLQPSPKDKGRGLKNMFRMNSSPSVIMQRPSILNAHRSSRGASETWEWREGRLFAYEVILQFLIKNHIIYTFGMLHQVPDQSDEASDNLPNPAVSVDEVLFARKSASSAANSQPESASYGGTSLKQTLRRTFSDKRRVGNQSIAGSSVVSITL